MDEDGKSEEEADEVEGFDKLAKRWWSNCLSTYDADRPTGTQGSTQTIQISDSK
jgi:hypothetical protein